jgi:hypothetical protein
LVGLLTVVRAIQRVTGVRLAQVRQQR